MDPNIFVYILIPHHNLNHIQQFNNIYLSLTFFGKMIPAFT